MNILGLSYIRDGGHDNSVTLIKDGELIFAEAAERATRKKHDGDFPLKTIEQAFTRNGLTWQDIDYIAIASPPLKSYSFLFERNFLDPITTFLYLLLNENKTIIKKLYLRISRDVEAFFSPLPARNVLANCEVDLKKINLIGHHQAHAASAYRTSPFQECLSVTLDGLGINAQGKMLSGEVYLCKEGFMTLVEEIPAFASFGSFYSGITEGLGFKAGNDEGKIMGLAAYGNPKECFHHISPYAPRFLEGKFYQSSLWIDEIVMPYFKNIRFAKYLKMLAKKFSKEDIAAATQKVLETQVNGLIEYLLKKYHQKYLVLSGGVFFNIKLNKILLSNKYVKDIYVQPFASDGGVSMGAALEVLFQKNGKTNGSYLCSADLGTSYTEKEILDVLNKNKSQITFERMEKIARTTAERICQGKVIGWFQGKAEWGPRALGNRSILADPRVSENRKRINNILKRREWFMPFAPSILKEFASEYLENITDSPFMKFSDTVKKEKRGLIPAVVHIDGTARPHIVERERQPLYHSLLTEFYGITGIPLLLNTSFNRHGLPIVHTPQDGIDHLLWKCVDELVIGPFLVKRKKE